MVETHSDYQTKMRVEYALQERDARVAAHIVEGIKHVMDMIEALRPPVIEALIDYCEKGEMHHVPADRMEVVGAMRNYARRALKEAREHENRLYYGLTGLPDPNEK
jgi:hypothetical protein